MTTVHEAILAELELLSLPSAQLSFEAALAGGVGHVPTELIAHFCNDLFHPRALAAEDAFTDDDLKDLAELYGLVLEAGRADHPTVTSMLKDPAWRRVVGFARDFHARLVRDHPGRRVRPGGPALSGLPGQHDLTSHQSSPRPAEPSRQAPEPHPDGANG